jgi:hypothetical protein
MALQLVQRLPRSWSLISKSYVRTVSIPQRERSILDGPSIPLVLILDLEKSVTDRVNAWIAKNNLDRKSGLQHHHTSMVLLKNLPTEHAPFYETQLQEICARHAPKILGSARPMVYPVVGRRGTKPIGFEWFPSQEVQDFYRDVAESFGEKIVISNFSKTIHGEDESPMEISRLCAMVLDVPLEMVAKAFDALDSAFPFGLDFGVSTGVELVEPVVKNVKYRKLFKFSKGK